METGAVVQAWGRILTGYRPNLSIEITRECPLRCPGCYAYGDQHLGGDVVLRQLADFKGQDLIDGVIDVVTRYKPVQLSIVGGEPLVRFRELETLLPMLTGRGIHVQVVTSAVRPIPESWAEMKGLQVCVSIDGLQPEHDVRRTPATYDRILKHIKGQHITVHCTVTRQQTRPGYLTEFTSFWAPIADVKRIWFSLYTPQKGEDSPERLRPEDRERVVKEILALHEREPKLGDMSPAIVRGYLRPPQNPDECIFSKTTACLSSDLKRAITPCQYGGDPDCTQCGCLASVGFEALGNYRLGGVLPLRHILTGSRAVG
ncbi:MAG TPA: radical SAM protein, partial [Vicinamibacterales bacterium]|nr:radical SAM protein [Vicinamibacterales bacterium]